ncbi:hypothetical protein C3Y92_05565 [Solidesulfovibrio carbinolicus]|uniref:Uncharacterized protein n=1 Tax=Solidesulfovibrio carbinolicus TaxID=296842 RepID=A0A4P6HNK7_9BACT|nr:hypothetical protein C3Y92_05565 [Solidesulfovibrio carbinolicus]
MHCGSHHRAVAKNAQHGVRAIYLPAAGQMFEQKSLAHDVRLDRGDAFVAVRQHIRKQTPRRCHVAAAAAKRLPFPGQARANLPCPDAAAQGRKGGHVGDQYLHGCIVAAGQQQPLMLMFRHRLGQIDSPQVQHLTCVALLVHDHGRHHQIERRAGLVRRGTFGLEVCIVSRQDDPASQAIQHVLHDAPLHVRGAQARQQLRRAVEQIARSRRAMTEVAGKCLVKPAALLLGLSFQKKDA